MPWCWGIFVLFGITSTHLRLDGLFVYRTISLTIVLIDFDRPPWPLTTPSLCANFSKQILGIYVCLRSLRKITTVSRVHAVCCSAVWLWTNDWKYLRCVSAIGMPDAYLIQLLDYLYHMLLANSVYDEVYLRCFEQTFCSLYAALYEAPFTWPLSGNILIGFLQPYLLLASYLDVCDNWMGRARPHRETPRVESWFRTTTPLRILLEGESVPLAGGAKRENL